MRRTLALAGAAVLTIGIIGLAGPAAADSDAGIASHGVVINQVGADLVDAGSGGNIQGSFVQIINHTGSSVELDDFTLSGCDATSGLVTFATIPVNTTLPNGETYLIADEAYHSGGGPLRDQQFAIGADLDQSASALRLVDSASSIQDAVKWGMVPDSTCASFPEALDPSGNPVSPNDTQSLNRDFSIDRWTLESPVL